MVNSSFTYGSNRYDAVCQNVSYSYSMSFGSSQGRRSQSLYPERWSADQNVNIDLIFPTPSDYLDFGRFLRGYYYAATSMNVYLPLRFVCTRIGADLNVIPKQDSLSIGIDEVAPIMKLNCVLVNNNAIERQAVSSASPDVTQSLFPEVELPDEDNYRRTRVIDAINQYGKIFVRDDSLSAEPEPFAIDGGRYYNVVQTGGYCYYGGMVCTLEQLLAMELYTREWVEAETGSVAVKIDNVFMIDGFEFTTSFNGGYEYTEVL